MCNYLHTNTVTVCICNLVQHASDIRIYWYLYTQAYMYINTVWNETYKGICWCILLLEFNITKNVLERIYEFWNGLLLLDIHQIQQMSIIMLKLTLFWKVVFHGQWNIAFILFMRGKISSLVLTLQLDVFS